MYAGLSVIERQRARQMTPTTHILNPVSGGLCYPILLTIVLAHDPV